MVQVKPGVQERILLHLIIVIYIMGVANIHLMDELETLFQMITSQVPSLLFGIDDSQVVESTTFSQRISRLLGQG